MDTNLNSSDCDFSLLPPHVIAHIFKYLNFRQRLNSARTCKSWYFGSCDPIIWKNTTVRIGVKTKTNRLEHFHRPFGTLVLNYINFDTFHNYKEFFAKFGQYIREIHLDYCNLSLEQLFDCLIRLKNLITLKLYVRGPMFNSEMNLNNSDMQIIKTNLWSVKNFVLALSEPDTGALHFIMSCMPNIKTLRFARSDFSTNLECQSLFEYFNMFPREVNLNCLELCTLHSSATTEFMGSFADITQNLNITEVILASIYSTYDVEYYHENFEIFCKKLSNVRALTIRSPSENQLVDICRYMTKLTELNLISLNHQNLQSVGYLHHIEKLTLQFDYTFIQNSDLVSEDIVLVELFPRLGNLKELDISQLEITQRAIEVLCLSCKRLTRLRLSSLVTNNFGLIFKHLTNLEYLNLWFWCFEEAHLDCDITNLRKLNELQISGLAPGITYELIEQLPNLKPSCMEYLKNNFKPGFVAPEYEATLNMMADLFDQ